MLLLAQGGWVKIMFSQDAFFPYSAFLFILLVRGGGGQKD